MFMPCSTCKTDVEPSIDRTTLKGKEVIATTKALCPTCRQDMKVNIYMMRTLAKMGQFYTQQVTRSAFSFECKVCDKVLPAVLSKNKKQALCSDCGTEIKISEMMIKAMAIAKNGNIDPQR